jgi:hypothetical protein
MSVKRPHIDAVAFAGSGLFLPQPPPLFKAATVHLTLSAT